MGLRKGYCLLKINKAAEWRREKARDIAHRLQHNPTRLEQTDIINDILLTLGRSRSNVLVYLDTLLLQYKAIDEDEFYHRLMNVLLGTDKRYDCKDDECIDDTIHLGYRDDPRDERILEYMKHGYDESMWEGKA